LVIKVEVLYAPTCANFLVWLEEVRKIVDDFDEDVIIEEIDVSEHPEAMKKYWSSVWPTFKEGYTHYFILVVVNGKILDWYWDTNKIAEAIRKEIEAEKK